MFNKAFKKIFIFPFIVIVSVCYFFILFGGRAGLNFSVSKLCYFFILFCFFASLMFFDCSLDNLIVAVAFLFTLLADKFLVLGGERETGMYIFCFAQGCYFLRNLLNVKDKTACCAAKSVFIALNVALIAISAAVTKENFQPLVLYAMVYLGTLAANIVFAALNLKTNPLFLVGLILFLLCDIFIGLAVLCDIMSLASDSVIYKLAYANFNTAWMFYVPSQAFIALSMFLRKKERIPLFSSQRLLSPLPY